MASKSTGDSYRVALNSSTAAMIKSIGFTSIAPAALESLVEMVQSFISQIGRSSKHYSEVANRSQVASILCRYFGAILLFDATEAHSC